MKVILTSDVEKVGSLGDIIEVKKGFVRNFLMPRKLALEITAHNVALMEGKKKKHQKKLELEKLSAVEQKQKLDGVSISIKKKAGENDVLFGSVTTAEIEKELAAIGISVERKKIHLEEPIKKLGVFAGKIKLFKDVDAEIKIEVLKDGEETPA
ncbi:MAG: 50S ribosomal protein L9 [Acidobacteria bacterium]|nr:50S ribosomal protein L9 [Acidobacteriota bacterium]MBU4306793.1 50S ribosomal protein L9 [Acidobacteriota bacterium]MCG2811527.1 50S ribosomal protein L9 [Candidatus Aminicenantes bacterium]